SGFKFRKFLASHSVSNDRQHCMRGFRKVCPKSFTIADCAALCRYLMAYLPMWMAAITPRCIRLRWAPPIYAICNPHATYLKVRKECRVMLCV
ncbi:hypothetical protein ABEB36_005893, partial [Hypothenemus hampei]